ncbi:MAG: DNA/RNA nuclease SfsA [Myxococcales bacterium]|nr:DNA/RNA nuclease SfsA [Myxococcales bacterium]
MLLRVPHPAPLIPGRLVDRYQRFIAEIELRSGERVRAHCVNPGRMEGQVRPGVKVWLTKVPDDSPRKLRYTWELVEEDGMIVGANTTAPNRIVAAVLAARVLPGLRRFRALRSEVAYGEGSRIDFLLEGATDHYIEVKNSHLVYPDGYGYFPDSVSARASEHLHALKAQARAGARATVLFTIQRPGVRAIRPSDLHDPTFATTAREVAASPHPVRFRALEIRPTLQAYEVLREIPVDLRAYDTAAHEGWREAKLRFSGWRKLPS